MFVGLVSFPSLSVYTTALMDPQRSATPSETANVFVGASIVTVAAAAPSVTVSEVITLAESSLNTTAFAVEAEQGSVISIEKLI